MLLPEIGEDPAAYFGFTQNPAPQGLRRRAETNLRKLRNGQNIAGMQGQVHASGTEHDSPGDGVLLASTLRPTPYRYSILIDRAKQLITLAQQMEAGYLAALEKRDAEAYNLIRARQDLGLTRGGVQLQSLRLTEAFNGINLAMSQQGRSQLQVDTYDGWIDGGTIQAENDLLQSYRDIKYHQEWLAGLDAATSTAQAWTSALSPEKVMTGAVIGAIVTTLAAVGRAAVSMSLSEAQMRSQVNSFNASYERRRQEWELQRSLAQKDVEIGAQQKMLAEDRVGIVGQEYAIAQMQADNAEATINFLANKFTNLDLYEWMSGILGGMYSYFLQQATAIARLASTSWRSSGRNGRFP